jgi:hypothetical protein
MPVAVAAEWFALQPRSWALANARILHGAGLTPAQGKELYDRLDSSVQWAIGRLVDAGRMAALDTENLHWWARAGLLTTRVTKDKRGRDKVEFTPWVTAARRYIAAVGGDQRLAALAAAAGLSDTETADRFADGSLDEPTLRMMAAFADSGPLFMPSVV